MKTLSAIFRQTALVLTCVAIISAAGCKSAPKTGGGDGPADSASIDENTLGDSDTGKAMGLQTIHFPYDSFTLDGEAKNQLKANAAVLKQNPAVNIQIEGHADSRGGIQYNIALGERRANAVRNYLVSQGIKGNRITTISYGKERLIDSGDSEEAHAKNRRANFVITSK